MGHLLEDTKLAIELEKKGYAFYLESAAKLKNLLAVSTLQSLADRELVHIERIKEFHKNLTGEEKLKSDWLRGVQTPPDKASLLKPILDKLKAALDSGAAAKNEKSETDKIYKIAEEFEKDSFKLYEKIAKENSNDDVAMKFYSALAIEENEHYEILSETLEYLNDPGEWYRRNERWIVEG